MNKLILGLFAFLFLSLVSGEEVVPIRTGLSPVFYICVIILAVGLWFIFFAVRKLNYNAKQIWKSIWISFVIALIISVITVFILYLTSDVYYGKLMVDCGNPPCPVPRGANSFIPILLFVLPVVFFFVLVVYYIIALIRRR